MAEDNTEGEMQVTHESEQPGQVVTPQPVSTEAASSKPQPSTEIPAPASLPTEPSQPDTTQTASSTGAFNPYPATDSFASGFEDHLEATPPQSAITWTASEYIAHEKSGNWYLGLGVCAVIVAIIVFLATRDIISCAVIIIGAILLGVYGARPPRQLSYTMDHGGFTVAQKHYHFGNFRSFALIPEGAFSSIVFMPLKRFATPITIYYAPDDEAAIIALISSSLPIDEEHQPDSVDRLMRRIRF